MADEETQATETDIFKQQQKTIELLQDAISRTQREGAQTVYLQPQPELQQKSPNYMLYIGIGLVALVLFGKVK